MINQIKKEIAEELNIEEKAILFEDENFAEYIFRNTKDNSLHKVKKNHTYQKLKSLQEAKV